jgi:heme-degrading monooxygenase HmoA
MVFHAVTPGNPALHFQKDAHSQTIGETVFIAMNRFKVVLGSQAEFEQVWTTRDTHLRDVPGFITFHLLRGPDRDDHTLYSSHSVWRSRADFEAWTRSEAFRRAHRDAGSNKPLYLGHPEFEGFEVIQTVEGTAPAR